MGIEFDKAYGAILGVLVGDAAGAPLEFYRGRITDSVVKNAMKMPGGGVLGVAPGQITDDGELTLSLAHALCGTNPVHGVPLDKIATNYVNWMLSNPFDVGNTCRRSFLITDKDKYYPGMETVPIHSHMMQRASEANILMESNGSLMRIIPMAIWSCGLPISTIAHNARMDALLSHPNQVCQDCNVLYCIAVSHLLQRPGDSKGAIAAVEDFIEAYHVHPKVREWFQQSTTISNLDCTICIGHVKYAFILAFYFLRKGTAFTQAIFETLMKGGDTDTNAAIVGGMMGVLHGASAVPDYMRNPVETFDCTLPQNDKVHTRDKIYSTKYIKEILKKLCI